MASHSCPSVESINSPDSTPNLSFSKTVSSLKPVSSKYLNKSFGYTISINWRSKLFSLVVILCTFSYSKAHTFLVILNTGFPPPDPLCGYEWICAERKSQAGTCRRQLSPPSFVRLPMAGSGMRDRQGANPTEPWKGVFVKHRSRKRSV